jgi:hypothetical protein
MARPFGTLKYDNVDELDKGINDYFADCEQRHAPYTLSGLAFWLNIDSKTLYNYSKSGDYFPTIYRARERCRQYAHECLYDRDKSRGAQFDLSANYGMSERKLLDIGNTNGEPLQISTLTDAQLAEQLTKAAALLGDNIASGKAD